VARGLPTIKRKPFPPIVSSQCGGGDDAFGHYLAAHQYGVAGVEVVEG
jgi:hypothetical protein